jgi:hypothetical protein
MLAPSSHIPSFLLPSRSQQDIARGRGMVDELFQGWGGQGGTANAIMSSSDYLSQVRGRAELWAGDSCYPGGAQSQAVT